MLKLMGIFSFLLLSTTRLGFQCEVVYAINSEHTSVMMINVLMTVTEQSVPCQYECPRGLNEQVT